MSKASFNLQKKKYLLSSLLEPETADVKSNLINFVLDCQ